MSRFVLAPVAVALSALLLAPVVAADPSSPLFVVEQQRAALVSRLARQWSDAFAALPKERRLDHEQLSNALFALRADRLFAVTLAGDAEAVEAVLADAKREAAKPRAAAKALGDATADLTYTPVNPCRILDTRATAAGPLAVNVARTFDGYSTNFATQGGTGSGCGIPNGVAALAMNVYAVNPTNLGFIKVWPANGTEPDVSTVNYQVGITAIATGTLVPVDQANSNRFTAKSPASVDFIADVVGYFKPPGDATSLDIKVAGQRVMRYEYNAISPNVIGGSVANDVAAATSGMTIAGGGAMGMALNAGGLSYSCSNGDCANRVGDAFGTIGGGASNRVGGAAGTPGGSPFDTVSGGFGNIASGRFATVGGGRDNRADYYLATVGGGQFNWTYGPGATISGGSNNYADDLATVGGGSGNQALGMGSTVSGGSGNLSTGNASAIGGGTGNSARGSGSVVVGGNANVAGGAYSVAAGRRARTETPAQVGHDGSFAFADSYDVDFHTMTSNEFATRSTGGVRFVTAIDGTGLPTWTCGVSGGAGGSWGCTSDRDAKTDLVPLDGAATLERLATLPVYQWTAKDDPRRTPHAGPTAQDFMAAFGLGDNDRMIGFADAQGVAFAAIQGLNAKLVERDREIAELKRVVEILLLRTPLDARAAADAR